ncbi:MAG: glycosyltransferase WbuB, partial [Chloroflexota bacterium]
NGADPRMFDPNADGTAFCQAHHLEGKFVALYAGAHGLSNDLEVVLEAARRLQDRPDIAIVLLGDGKEKRNLMAKAAEMRLNNVIFASPVPKNEMPAAIAACDACIAILKPIPLYATVYPNKVFDYMAAGRPVVLAIAGVIQEVVESAGAGIAVPPGNAQALADAIRTLAEQPQEGLAMGMRGRQYIEQRFDRVTLAENLEKLFLEGNS